MNELHIFTSAALNYIPKVRMLARSCREFHPEAKFHLALADVCPEDLDLSGEPFDSVLPIAELDIPAWVGWAFCHRIVELSTAIKPFALKKLLSAPASNKVLYIDPDIVLFSRLDDLIGELDEASIVLTPHVTEPEKTLRGVMDNEISALKHGTYNLGFLGVRADATGARFAEWWGQRCYHFCRDDIANGLFTDQRWVDLVPSLFPGVCVHRGSRHNVASWNVSSRKISHSSTKGYEVDGRPLGFYHFTGFDSGAHRIMAGVYGDDNPALAHLIEWYAKAIEYAEGDPITSRQWAFSAYSDGTEIDPAARIIYRQRKDLQRIFEDPFQSSGYLQWWLKQAPREYPGLFDGNTRLTELGKVMRELTPGYEAGKETTITPALTWLIKEAVKKPKFGRALFTRLLFLWKRNGVKSVIQRLRKEIP